VKLFFIVEQNCPYPDADGRDPTRASPGWLQGAQERVLVAYARICEPGVNTIKADRSCRHRGEVRGTELEGLMVKLGAPQSLRSQPDEIAAQRRWRISTSALGFRTVSDSIRGRWDHSLDMVI